MGSPDLPEGEVVWPVNRRYIHYGQPSVAGLYYQENDTYYQNNDCSGGKVIILVPARKDGKRKAVK